jgi:branched-chain amino acid transport system substrate-binding protein
MKLKNLFALITAPWPPPGPGRHQRRRGGLLTGPAAALGAETRKAVSLFPTTVGGEKVNFILLDDATDPTAAVKNVRKLISEDKVDAILGPNLISTAVAMADVANGEKVPMISVAPLDVSGDKRGFVFRSEPSADLMVQRVVADMLERRQDRRLHRLLGFLGRGAAQGLTKAAEGKITIVATERYGRADPSVQAQVLKVISAKPDAVFVGASGTPPRCPRSPCASAASRAASTSPTASPARSSCGSAARTSKAR